ncbi:MAG: hypothetical protein IH613_00435 [Desulfuromonadales bacterium]|nr:hypothetical protein [Desulfuromonadales bacterium]
MHRLIKPIFWSFLFLVMLLVIDQFLVQVPPVHPAHAAASNFYRDFRSRLINLVSNEKQTAPKSIEAVIEKQQGTRETMPQKIKKPGQEQTRSASNLQAGKSQRYLYSDGKGELHFTDSLDEVPDKYRGQAQPMGQ